MTTFVASWLSSFPFIVELQLFSVQFVGSNAKDRSAPWEPSMHDGNIYDSLFYGASKIR